MDDAYANGGMAMQPEAPTTEGYTIEIMVDGQGQISVGVEPAGMEAQEAGEESPSEEQSQPVGSINECLQLVKQIYSSSGQMQESGADKAAMTSGYKA